MNRGDGLTEPMKSRILQRAVLALLLVLAAGCEERTVVSPGPQVGEAFPALVFPALDGGVRPIAELRGKVVVINFWATWCAPCREEMPSLQRLSERVDPARVQVIAITVDEDLNLAREFLLRHGIRFPVWVDPAGALAAGVLGVTSYPDTFLLDGEGRVVERVRGLRDWGGDGMVARLEALAARGRRVD